MCTLSTHKSPAWTELTAAAQFQSAVAEAGSAMLGSSSSGKGQPASSNFSSKPTHLRSRPSPAAQ